MALTYDREKKAHICSIHGDVGEDTGWVPCYAGCDDGWIDDYDEDPINCDPGDMSRCPECHGAGGFTVCGQCNRNNPEVQW